MQNSRPCRACQAHPSRQSDMPVVGRAGVPVSSLEVRFKDLTVTAPIGVGASGLPNVANAYTNGFMVPPLHIWSCHLHGQLYLWACATCLSSVQ